MGATMKTALVFSTLFCAALALPAAPGYAPEPVYDDPPVYSYQYGVADDYSGANFDQNESRDGYATTGSYRVALPDGRTQVVSYHTADAYSGNVAEVTYEGVPTYGPAPVVAHARPVVAHAAPIVAHAPVAVAHAPIAVAHAPVVAHAAPLVAHRPVAVAHAP